MYKKFLKLPFWRKLSILAVLGVTLFVVWFIYEILTDEPPRFFPLNDNAAQYKITKNCPSGQGWIEKTSKLGNAYCLEYRGNNVLMKEDYGGSNFFSITVGNSDINLESLIGKNVKNIKGRYTNSTKQCIQDRCIDIGGPFVVVDLDGLEISE